VGTASSPFPSVGVPDSFPRGKVGFGFGAGVEVGRDIFVVGSIVHLGGGSSWVPNEGSSVLVVEEKREGIGGGKGRFGAGFAYRGGLV